MGIDEYVDFERYKSVGGSLLNNEEYGVFLGYVPSKTQLKEIQDAARRLRVREDVATEETITAAAKIIGVLRTSHELDLKSRLQVGYILKNAYCSLKGSEKLEKRVSLTKA